jgi:hypothetical protein
VPGTGSRPSHPLRFGVSADGRQEMFPSTSPQIRFSEGAFQNTAADRPESETPFQVGIVETAHAASWGIPTRSHPKDTPIERVDKVKSQRMNPLLRPLRIFISYRRRAQLDARLADVLRIGLEQGGCEVFVDTSMPVGIDWSKEIGRRIEWCDFMVVLLSADSVSSEMVQAEVRRAHHLSKPGAPSKILPVRVSYLGALSYEMEGYIGGLQYILWEQENDDHRVLQALLKAAGAHSSNVAEPVSPALSVSCGPADRPEPKADMRVLRQMVGAPGSPLDSQNPFYVRRDVDDRIDEFAQGPARTLIIKGPSQTGKSSLLLRYLAQCMANGKRVALVDLVTFGALKKQSFSDFSAQFVDAIIQELGLSLPDVPRFTTGRELTNFMHDRVLARVQGPVVIALDDADRPIGTDWQDDIFTALRGWDGNRTHPVRKRRWGDLGLALVISTDPQMLVESGYVSPFNVTPPERVWPFDRPALDVFNESYRRLLTSQQLDRVFDLLRGHPYLTPLTFYRLIQDGATFDSLCAEAAKENGPFGDHLRSKLDRLYIANLHGAMREVVFSGRTGADRRIFYRLEAAGLVREEAGRVIAANQVYENFFRSVL